MQKGVKSLSSSCTSRDSSAMAGITISTNGTRINRRKWVLEKWLIWITFLVTSIFLDSAYGEVMCYECAWQGSSPLPSTADGVSDVCRPHNFNVQVVHKIKCANGCIKQALYEFENDPSAIGNNNTNSSSSTNRTRSINIENMTFYVRGCQKNKKTRETCENKSYNDQVYAEECVCLDDFCNGEKSGASRISFRPTTVTNNQKWLFLKKSVGLSVVLFLVTSLFPLVTLEKAQ